MTNEEAITVLNMVEAHGSLVVQAKDMAIKALSAEPCECTEHPCLGKLCRYYQEPCEDAISRKEVIETIEWYDKDRYIECSNDMIEYIKKMPSVKPQYTEAEIQKMQEMEQAEIQKAYELGKERSEKFQQKAEVVISQLRADRDRLEDEIAEIRAEISEYGSIWVQYTIKGTTNKDIEDIVENAIKQAKEQVLYIIDKHTKGREGE